ncbi:phosphotransferase [Arthrobacter sp. UCD-GKA]|uniref:phosphotransferase family protein n=1 Tax=Arthrobacter sp. UCD-GKA TaxID=1913576 RepID=UPI0008DE8553|nr:phosphotransferase family protein [Arthrobacter sp. UCD-GKA]OIH85218.1 phosphotransferase [Arthrobacter sp. UCD-GKA]
MAWDWTTETLASLGEFLEVRGVMGRTVTARRIGDGHSNLTYLVTDGQEHAVVRRPPPPPTPPGANDMLREARILSALANTGVPVPPVLATADAGEVLDVAFYVMGFASGHVITSSTPEPLDTPQGRREIAESMLDTLVKLHAIDPAGIGLDDIGRSEGFNARHLRRMGQLVADPEGNPPPQFAVIYQWLAANVPAESGAALIHNDFRIGNVVVAQNAPGRIEAVLDWELATLGDPLFDLGYFLSSIPEQGQQHTPTEELGVAMLEEGYPSRAELAERYAQKTGQDLSALPWYTAMALWKLAVLYEYSRRRVIEGIGDPYYADPALVTAFLEEAHRTAGLSAPNFI